MQKKKKKKLNFLFFFFFLNNYINYRVERGETREELQEVNQQLLPL